MATPYVISSDLVSAYPAKSLEIAQYIDGFKADLALVQNAQTGTTYTLAATDFTKLVTLSNASPVTVTVPLESSVAWVAGTQLRLMNLGAGLVTVVGAGGVTINGSPLTLEQYKNGTLTKTGTDTWTFDGSPGAPGIDLITTATATAAATVSVNNCFTATYDNYLVVVEFTSSSASGEWYLRLRASATDATTAYYSAFGFSSFGADSISGQGSTNGTDKISVGFSNSTLGATASINVKAPAIARRTVFEFLSNNPVSSGNTRFGGGVHSTATAYDGFTVYPASGTITTPTNGIRVYGLKNA
jgi:hypothetical protein